MDSGKEAIKLSKKEALPLALIGYVIWGLVMVVLALALYQRLKSGSPALAQTATAIELIWATVIIANGMIRNLGMGPAKKFLDHINSQSGKHFDPQIVDIFMTLIKSELIRHQK